MKPRNKEQFNVWIPKEMRSHVLAVSDKVGWTRNEIAEIAIATLFGRRDGLTREKRKIILKASRQMGAKLPFDRPLTPFKNNALTC